MLMFMEFHGDFIELNGDVMAIQWDFMGFNDKNVTLFCTNWDLVDFPSDSGINLKSPK